MPVASSLCVVSITVIPIAVQLSSLNFVGPARQPYHSHIAPSSSGLYWLRRLIVVQSAKWTASVRSSSARDC